MKMFLDGQWETSDETLEVLRPYDQSVLDTVPSATPAQVERAIAGAVRGAEIMRKMSGYERFEILRRAAETIAPLRVLTLHPNSGQSAAFEAGFRAARGDVLVTLDGDGQNDPADIPTVLAALEGEVAVFGVRARRADPAVRKLAQRVANGVRNFVLGSHYQDVGCSLKAFRREVIADVTLYNGLHRFFPYLVEMHSRRGVEIDVSHRARKRGVSKYRAFGRGWPAFWDLLMVRRMMRRALRYSAVENPVARERDAVRQKASDLAKAPVDSTTEVREVEAAQNGAAPRELSTGEVS